jgi:hypothetical protein
MPKHYKQMMDEIINKMDEDAPANAVAHGGVDMAPNAGPKKKKKDVSSDADVIVDFKKKMKESNDNNNVMLKQILDGVEKAENKLDEKTFGATEIKVEVKEEIYKTFKDKYVKNS